MRRLSANYIYRFDGFPLKNGIIETDDDGKIINIIDTQGELKESRNLEFYNGVIVPGFVNTHCHLELSELKNKIPEKERLPEFIGRIANHKKNTKSDVIIKSIDLQDTLMQMNGIVAVGDICNTNKTIQTKLKSKIYYHNFIEAIGLSNNAKEIFKKNIELSEEFSKNKLKNSIVPHASYSVSAELLGLIKNFAEKNNSILSIHNQETISENEMFISKSGELFNKLKTMVDDFNSWEASGKSSLQTIIEFLPTNNNILFVHNTYSSSEDLQIVNNKLTNSYLCLCPRSNLYIEGSIPNIKLFLKYPEKVTLGTDSLASNSELSILKEMKVLQEECKNLSFDILLKWGTLNGARALNIEEKFGSIKIGKTPGLNLITNFDFEKMKITNKSEVKVLF